jgi:hypothetical protein
MADHKIIYAANNMAEETEISKSLKGNNATWQGPELVPSKTHSHKQFC